MVRKKKYLLPILFVCFVVYIFVTVDLVEILFVPKITPESAQILCYDEDVNFNNTVLPVLNENLVVKNNSIFFVETSCNDGKLLLNPRQACAIESAANMNPDKDVYLLVSSPIKYKNFDEHINRLYLYKNIKLRRLNMNTFFDNTPLESFYKKGMLKSSRWPKSHASDVLRYTALWKFGGYYLDLDIVMLKPFEIMNFAGAEDNMDIAAGFLSYSYQHSMANISIEDLSKNFKGWIWGNNGPGVITRSLQKYCQVKEVSKMTVEQCNGFTVFKPSVFYPIPWREWKDYFVTKVSEVDRVMLKLNNSMAIHVWNFHSKSMNATVGSNQPYVKIASLFCPKVYSSLDKFF